MIGSLDLVQSLLRFGLVDRLELWMYPLLLGSGKRVFAGGAVPTTLRLDRIDHLPQRHAPARVRVRRSAHVRDDGQLSGAARARSGEVAEVVPEVDRIEGGVASRRFGRT